MQDMSIHLPAQELYRNCITGKYLPWQLQSHKQPVVYEQFWSIPCLVSFLLILTFKILETQANSFCPKSRFNGMLSCSDSKVTERSRPKFECHFPSETAGAMPGIDRGKEINKGTCTMPRGNVSLRSLDLPKAAVMSPGVMRPPGSPTQQLFSVWNSWDKIISQHGSSQVTHHQLRLECCPFLFT